LTVGPQADRVPVAVGIPRPDPSGPGVHGSEPRTLCTAEHFEVAGHVERTPEWIELHERDAGAELFLILRLLARARAARTGVEGT
jgi:hypothetical protein